MDLSYISVLLIFTSLKTESLDARRAAASLLSCAFAALHMVMTVLDTYYLYTVILQLK